MTRESQVQCIGNIVALKSRIGPSGFMRGRGGQTIEIKLRFQHKEMKYGSKNRDFERQFGLWFEKQKAKVSSIMVACEVKEASCETVTVSLVAEGEKAVRVIAAAKGGGGSGRVGFGGCVGKQVDPSKIARQHNLIVVRPPTSL